MCRCQQSQAASEQPLIVPNSGTADKQCSKCILILILVKRACGLLIQCLVLLADSSDQSLDPPNSSLGLGLKRCMTIAALSPLFGGQCPGPNLTSKAEAPLVTSRAGQSGESCGICGASRDLEPAAVLHLAYPTCISAG